MATLPTPNGDNEVWGTKLNNWLLQSFNDDGTLKSSVLSGGSGGSVGAGLAVLKHVESATNITSTNSATWKTGIYGADQMGLTFTAPASGIAWIMSTVHGSTSGANGGAYTVIVNKPDGSALYAAGAEGLTMYCNPTSYIGGSIWRRIVGLTGGLNYTATSAIQVSGTSGTTVASWRAITVMG